MEKKLNSKKITAGVIVLLFANTVASGAEWCSAALQNIAINFPDVPYSIISLVLNIPNFCAVIFSLVAGALVGRKVSLKTMLLIAIGFHAIGGALPAVFGNTSIGMVLLSRFVFGIGYGLMNGMGIAISFTLVKDEKLRAHAYGWAVAAQYAMNLLAQLVIGILSDFQWYYAFLFYLWGIIPFVVVALLCPKFAKDEAVRVDKDGNKIAEADIEPLMTSVKKLPVQVWVAAIITTVYMFAYYPFFLTTSTIVMERGMGGGAEAGVALTFYAVATLVGGVAYGFLQKIFKQATLLVCLIGVGLSMLGLYFSTSFPMLCAFMVLSGVTSPGIIPACYNMMYGFVPVKRQFIAAGFVQAGVNLGAFFTTPYIMLFEKLNLSPVQALLVSPVLMVILGLCTLGFCKKAEIRNKEIIAEANSK